MVIFTSFLGTPCWELSTVNGRMRLARMVPSLDNTEPVFVGLFIT